MESFHETGRLARIDAALLPACESLWAIHAGPDAAYSFVSHQARIKKASQGKMSGKRHDVMAKLRCTYLLCGYKSSSLTQGLFTGYRWKKSDVKRFSLLMN